MPSDDELSRQAEEDRKNGEEMSAFWSSEYRMGQWDPMGQEENKAPARAEESEESAEEREESAKRRQMEEAAAAAAAAAEEERKEERKEERVAKRKEISAAVKAVEGTDPGEIEKEINEIVQVDINLINYQKYLENIFAPQLSWNRDAPREYRKDIDIINHIKNKLESDDEDDEGKKAKAKAAKAEAMERLMYLEVLPEIVRKMNEPSGGTSKYKRLMGFGNRENEGPKYSYRIGNLYFMWESAEKLIEYNNKYLNIGGKILKYLQDEDKESYKKKLEAMKADILEKNKEKAGQVGANNPELAAAVEARFGGFNEDMQMRMARLRKEAEKNSTVKKRTFLSRMGFSGKSTGKGPKKRKNTRKPKRRKNAKGTKKKGKPTKSYKKIGTKRKRR